MQKTMSFVRGGAGAALLLAVLAACGDGSVAPTTSPLVGPELRVVKNDTTTTSLLYIPSQGISTTIGGVHHLYMAPWSVCDTRGGYGPGTWDTECTPTTDTVRITARSWKNVEGDPVVEFQPAMRFAPATDTMKMVWLYMKDRTEALRDRYKILYCPDLTLCVDEAIVDKDLVTLYDDRNHFLYRRLKHFSAYNVAAGDVSLLQ